MTARVYQHLASAIIARLNCLASGNTEWKIKHEQNIEQIARDLLPSGAGIDSGSHVDLDRSNGDRIVITTSYHHMNDGGYYDGWTEHTVSVRPSFLSNGIDVAISGRNRNDIKDYLCDTFLTSLAETVEHTYNRETETDAYRRIA